ncbi:hypothetical protein Tco_1008648 [Tanacetum coccineum]
MWYDRWSDSCPLINLLSPRDIAREAPDLGIIPAHVLEISVPDKRQWRDRSGNVMDFSVAKACEAIRNHGNQDVGPNGDVTNLRCALCDGQPDSHPHLFFECTFSAKVWRYVRVLADMDNVP